MEQKNIKNPNLFCELCNFQATRPAEFLRHVESQKHQRKGHIIKNTTFKCLECDKTLSSHFSYKIHMVQIHGSIEERKKQKYYCESCDVVFISKLFMDKHNSGKKHNNMLKSIQYINDIKKIIADDNKISTTKYADILNDLYLEPIPNFEDLISDCNAEINRGKKLLKHFENSKN
jgi:hypothetical protein